MLFHFINVLLQVLLHKSHDLLQEEITLAIYNMASVDFDAFYSAFMPEFLNGCHGVDSSQRAVLARNFKLEQVSSVALSKKKNAARVVLWACKLLSPNRLIWVNISQGLLAHTGISTCCTNNLATILRLLQQLYIEIKLVFFFFFRTVIAYLLFAATPSPCILLNFGCTVNN